MDQRNAESAKVAEDLAGKARAEVIDLAYDAIEVYLQDDKSTFTEAFEGLESTIDSKLGETVGFYVVEDMLAAPEVPQGFVRTFGILLVDAAVHEAMEASDDFGTELDDDEVGIIDGVPFSRLKVHIPVDDDTYIQQFTMPHRKTVNAAYLEYSYGNEKPPLRYAVTNEGLYEFTIGTEGNDLEGMSYAQFMQRATARVSEESVLALSMLRNVTNMRAVPQRYVDLGSPEVTDI